MPVPVSSSQAKGFTSEGRREILQSLGLPPFAAALVEMLVPDPTMPMAFGKIRAPQEVMALLPQVAQRLNEVLQKHVGVGWGTKILERIERDPRIVDITIGTPHTSRPTNWTGMTSLPFNRRAPVDVYINPATTDIPRTLGHELVHANQELAKMWGKTEGVKPTLLGRFHLWETGYPRKDWADELLPYLVDTRSVSKVTDPNALYRTLMEMTK